MQPRTTGGTARWFRCGEEVRGNDDLLVRFDEVSPRDARLPSACRRDAVPSKHATDSFVRHLMAEVGQGAGDAIVAPRCVLLGKAENQLLDLSFDPGPTGPSLLGPIVLLRHKPPVPRQDGLGRHDRGDIGQRPDAEALSELCEPSTLMVGQRDATAELRAQDLVLPCEILVSEEQFLIYVSPHQCQCLDRLHPVPPCSRRPSSLARTQSTEGALLGPSNGPDGNSGADSSGRCRGCWDSGSGEYCDPSLTPAVGMDRR